MKLPENIAKQILADHQARPRHRGELPGAPHAALDNPGCGDQVTVWARVEDGRLAALSFTGRGCAVSQASASLMTVALRGKTLAQARELAAQYRAMVLGEAGDHGGGDPALGDLLALAGVGRLLARRRCALLAWNALDAALAAPEAAQTGTEVARTGGQGAP
ncbi:Fe-S cluster assembly sulfur transfer protein SufU [Deinococcus petrolearius]|uniref:Fe-S cluster assembly sulfur transfer protein SufU n=1 Tax=Deinococcus petrolearius TaxID=1751295 RepID=A0ABW1DND8_9DEIO